MIRHVSHPRNHNPAFRRGSMLVELMVASVVLAVLMTVCLQLLAASSRQQRLADHRQLAGEELANLMERITARPYGTIDQQSLQETPLNAAVAAYLKDSRLDVAVEAVSDPLPGKKISLQLRWHDAGDVVSAPVRLTTWVYAPAGGGA